jgi:hypothetical protein
MKHIRIYEEYSDNDLKDLMGDLDTIGHKHQLVKGKDFGFGIDLKGKNDALNQLYFTTEAVSFLSEAGIVKDLRIYEVGKIRESKDEYPKRVSGELDPTEIGGKNSITLSSFKTSRDGKYGRTIPGLQHSRFQQSLRF